MTAKARGCLIALTILIVLIGLCAVAFAASTVRAAPTCNVIAIISPLNAVGTNVHSSPDIAPASVTGRLPFGQTAQADKMQGMMFHLCSPEGWVSASVVRAVVVTPTIAPTPTRLLTNTPTTTPTPAATALPLVRICIYWLDGGTPTAPVCGVFPEEYSITVERIGAVRP